MEDKELIEFYQKKFREIEAKNDKYIQEVDKHLRDLAADRHELEAEILRRGTKISDLQKALVELQIQCFEEREKFLEVSAENDKLKKNEEKLHEDIRHLLEETKDIETRDRIIYTLENPDIDIAYRYRDKLSAASKSRKSSDDFLKEQIDSLQSQLEEYTRVSHCKSDVILEDCKQALENSRIKIQKDDDEINELQEKLQDKESELSDLKEAFSELKDYVLESEVSSERKHTFTGTEVHSKTRSTSLDHSKTTDSIMSRNRGAGRTGTEHFNLLYGGNRADPNIADPSMANDDILSVRKGVCRKRGNTEDNDTVSQEKSFVRTLVETEFSDGSSSTKENISSSVKYRDNTGKSNALNVKSRLSSSLSQSKALSSVQEMHLTLLLLSKTVGEVASRLGVIRSTNIYKQAANLPIPRHGRQAYVPEIYIIHLQNYVRQCTRLCYDANNMLKSFSALGVLEDFDIEWEVRQLEFALEDLTVATAEADLINISLSRSTFYNFLTKPSEAFQKFGVKDLNNHSKYVADIEKMEANMKTAEEQITRAIKYSEMITQKVKGGQPGKTVNEAERISERKDHSRLPFSSILNIENFEKSRSRTKSPSKAKTKSVQTNKCGSEFLTRRIDKTLAKISHIERGEHRKDAEFVTNLGQQIDSLSKKMKQLYEEFSVSREREQFTEYSAAMLSKLETLAKQSRDTVIAAEAEMKAHQANAKLLSNKLKTTEDLLRESVNECLRLKQQVLRLEEQRVLEKTRIGISLRSKLDRVSDFGELETVVQSFIASLGEPDNKWPTGPFECMYCRQGGSHRECEKTIKELRASERRLTTELKLKDRELKDEKKVFRVNRAQAEKTAATSVSESEQLRTALLISESKNKSLTEQLNLEKNRLKNMERFRRYEMEGFQTDIKNLKSKIREMEKQIMKAVLVFEQDKKDLELLQSVQETTQNSHQACVALKRLKAKLYQLETDIKHL